MVTSVVLGATGIAVAIAAILAASTKPVPPPTLAREVVTMRVGDTLTPRYAVKTDSVLGVGPQAIIARKCGVGTAYLRLWQNGKALSGDTVQVVVTGCAPPPPPVATVTVCVSGDTAAFSRYAVSGDTTVDPVLIPCLDDGLPVPIGTRSRAYAVARDAGGKLLTGRHVAWTETDSAGVAAALRARKPPVKRG